VGRVGREIGRKNVLGLFFLNPPPHPQEPSARAVAARCQGERRAGHLARRLGAFPALVSACWPLASATPPPMLLCRATGHQPTLPSCSPASTLPARRGGASGLPPSLLSVAAPPSLPAPLLSASLLRAGLLQCCRLPAAGVRALLPPLRQSASRAVVPRCRPPCPPGSGLHPLLGASLLDRLECSTPGPCNSCWPAPCSTRWRQSAPSLSLLQTPVLCATMPGIVLLLKFDLSCLNFFAI
jgi:hypothetical protein